MPELEEHHPGQRLCSRAEPSISEADYLVHKVPQQGYAPRFVASARLAAPQRPWLTSACALATLIGELSGVSALAAIHRCRNATSSAVHESGPAPHRL